MDIDGNKRIFHRLGPSQSNSGGEHQRGVCFHWKRGRCDRYPCPFLHSDLPPAPPQHAAANGGVSSKRPQGFDADYHGGGIRRKPAFNNTWGRQQSYGGSGGSRVERSIEEVCSYFIRGSCKFGDKCKFLHIWSTGNCFQMLTQLEGHQKGVTGIALPSGSDKLYTGSKDRTVRIWDCQSGQCAAVVNLDSEVSCLLSEGPWVFVGLTDLVKAWNTQSGAELSLSGPVGQVYALVVGNDLLFAGAQDGGILAWKYNVATNFFEPAASLRGHTKGVVTLVVGANRMYSGSMDKSIRVWSLETLQCLQTLTEHNNVVMSVLCWDQFLLSCSLDKTVKIWGVNQNGILEVVYTHTDEDGLITLCGMHDAEAKPVLLCACNDNTVRVYDLPSFSERGKLFTKKEVHSIQIGPGGLFFTGDGSGQVRVWKWLTETPATT